MQISKKSPNGTAVVTNLVDWMKRAENHASFTGTEKKRFVLDNMMNIDKSELSLVLPGIIDLLIDMENGNITIKPNQSLYRRIKGCFK